MNPTRTLGVAGTLWFAAAMVSSLLGAGLRSADVVHVPGSTRKVHQLTGELDLERLEPTLNRTSSRYGVRGTDLGATFEHGGRLWFIFGDTYAGRAVAGASGVPGYIQSRHGVQGNFEVVTPLAAGGLAYYWRDNDAPGFPWLGPILFGGPALFDAVSLIASNFGDPGNLEVVASSGGRLLFLWRDAGGWQGPFLLVADGTEVSGVTGNPACIQGRYGVQGNFEVVVPLAAGGLAHYWRDNDAPGLPWHGPVVFGGSTSFDAVSLVESNFGDPGNLEVVARSGGRLLFHWRDGGGWHGPFPMVADGVEVAGVSGNPAFIQSRFGVQGNFEVVAPLAAGGLALFWRDNDAAGLPWHGPLPFAERGAGFAAVSLIQGNFGSPGNLEVVARKGEHLISFWRDGHRDSDAIASSADGDPEDGLTIDFATAPDGAYLSPRVTDRGQVLRLDGFEVPAGGFSWGGNAYVFFTDDHLVEAGEIVMGRSFLAVAQDPVGPFTKLYDVSRRADEAGGGFKFVNVAPVMVENGDFPGISTPTGPGLLVWGSGRYRKSDVYLAHVPLSGVERLESWRYLAAAGGSGPPVWSASESDAAPLLAEDCVGEFSVSWNPFLRRWLMLYNCDGPRGIVFRTAEKPWGPWSPAAVIFDPRADGGYCRFLHNDWRDRNCDSVFDNMFGPSRENEWGGEYGPYVISKFTTGDATQATIYFVLSTWNPYNTVLMKSTLRVAAPAAGLQRAADCNQDGRLDISDPVCLLGHLFNGQPARLPCSGGTLAEAANRRLFDANGDRVVDLSDAVFELLFLFSGGPPPAEGMACVGIEGCPESCPS
jgi:hypothetical protein